MMPHARRPSPARVLSLLVTLAVVLVAAPRHAAARQLQAGASISNADAASVVSTHNKHRARHGAPPLVWDKTVAASAQAWADRCKFEHSSSGYGENLAWGFSSWQAVVDAWYDEQKLYDYKSHAWSTQIGHFTQVVWKGTTKIGCGKACDVWVCQYSPAGNVLGQFSWHVAPPVQQKSGSGKRSQRG